MDRLSKYLAVLGRRDRPLLLWAMMTFGGAFATVITAMLLIAPTETASAIWRGFGKGIDGFDTTADAGLVEWVYTTVLAVTWLVVSYGIMRERVWVRQLVPMWLVSALVLGAVVLSLRTEVDVLTTTAYVAMNVVGWGAITVWYFERKKSVVRYYRSRGESDDGHDR